MCAPAALTSRELHDFKTSNNMGVSLINLLATTRAPVFPPRFGLNHGWETLKVIMRQRRQRKIEREMERNLHGQWATSIKRLSDFSEAIIIKILPPRLFVWGGHGRLWRRKFRAVINTPKWLLLDGRQGRGLLLLWAGTVTPSMSHSFVGWHVHRGGGNGESAFITRLFVCRALFWSGLKRPPSTHTHTHTQRDTPRSLPMLISCHKC